MAAGGEQPQNDQGEEGRFPMAASPHQQRYGVLELSRVIDGQDLLDGLDLRPGELDRLIRVAGREHAGLDVFEPGGEPANPRTAPSYLWTFRGRGEPTRPGILRLLGVSHGAVSAFATRRLQRHV